MSILDKNNEMIRLFVAPNRVNINYYAPYEVHTALMEEHLDAFQDTFTDLVHNIWGHTDFTFSTSTVLINGIETDVESLTTWHPNWYILLILDRVLTSRLTQQDLRIMIAQKLESALDDQMFDPDVRPILNYYWLEDPSQVLIELTFEYERVLS